MGSRSVFVFILATLMTLVGKLSTLCQKQLQIFILELRDSVCLEIRYFDILPDLKVQGFWIQTAIAGIARLTSPSPTDNALPVATILPKSRPRRTGL